MGLPTTVNGIVWLFFVIALCFMVTRTISLRMSRRLRWDWVLAWISFSIGLAANIMCSISVSYGAGLPQDTLETHNVVQAVKWQWFLFYTYVIAVTIAKLAIIAFLLEFEQNISSNRKWLLYAVAVINIGVNMGTSSLQWQQCNNVRATWDFTLTGKDAICNGRERNTKGGYVQGSFAAAIDVFLALYPAIVFWHLKMDKRVRIGLCALFSCGFISCALAILKTIGISKLAATDSTYDLAVLDIYSLVELWVALIVGSIPPSKPFFNRYITGKIGGSKTGHPSNSGYIEHSSHGGLHNHNSHMRASVAQHGAAANLYSVKGNSAKYGLGGSSTSKDQFGSEESILPLEDTKHGILLTKTVRIDNDKA